ncbi:hypothetical protein BEN47_16895 [Hymenobacter lapidarius]|uniref:DUF4199 domain-containing protein n=1 Tax=Hymenobacter lapidarius TaxID=1908237 RepID=A0A1G1SZM4_9BACT|nr:DUF4199 domain-containing protein [Hymenobacter lapidarius]OGX84056.1 hypothetical protein BEN47_16895 [Hymenobacter lapidarius]
METNSTSVSTTSVGLRYGLLTGLVSIIISFGIFAAQMEDSPIKYISYLVLIGGLVMAMRYYKANNLGFMSYGEGLGIGVMVSAVVGVLSAIFTYVYMNIIDTDAVARMTEKVRAGMEEGGKLTDEQIDQSMAMAGKFMNGPFMVVAVVISSVLVGLVFSLVISAFIKHTKPEFE